MTTTEQLTIKASPHARVMDFLDEFRAMPNNSDIEIRLGLMENGEPAVVVTLNDKYHGFTAKEARMLARIAEEAMNQIPSDPESATLPNLILALRYGADQAEAQKGHSPCPPPTQQQSIRSMSCAHISPTS